MAPAKPASSSSDKMDWSAVKALCSDTDKERLACLAVACINAQVVDSARYAEAAAQYGTDIKPGSYKRALWVIRQKVTGGAQGGAEAGGKKSRGGGRKRKAEAGVEEGDGGGEGGEEVVVRTKGKGKGRKKGKKSGEEEVKVEGEGEGVAEDDVFS